MLNHFYDINTWKIYGKMASEGALKFASADEILQTAVEIFQDHFKSKAECAAVAPGRVNLIGEHTDYSEGFVFPMVSQSKLGIISPIQVL